MKKENLLGQKFARLLVIAEAEPVGNRKRPAWECQCDCGNIKTVKSEELKNGDTKSCGCLNNEKRKERAYILYSSNIKYTPKEASARVIWRKRYNDGISFEDFLRLSQMNCYYCDIKPITVYNAALDDKKSSQFAKENGDFLYNGLDRLDNNKLHTLDNVVTCCKWCNYSKRERSPEEFEIWIEQIHQTLQKRKGL